MSVVQADSEDEALDQIELSDIGEDELIDMDTQIVTEKKLRSFLEHLRNKPNTNQVGVMIADAKTIRIYYFITLWSLLTCLVS